MNTYFARVDHNINAANRVFVRLAMDRDDLARNNINPNLPVFVNSKVTNLATQWIHMFGRQQDPGDALRLQYLRRPDIESADR